MASLRSIALGLLLSMAGAHAQTVSPCPADVPADTICYTGGDAVGAYYLIAVPKVWNGALLTSGVLGGHNPFTNEGVRYVGSTDDDALNRGVQRFHAEPQAVAEPGYDSDLTGAMPISVLTVRAIDDPTAFVEHESSYREAVDHAGNGRLLVQTFTREAEHSKLNTPQYAAALRALREWIERGAKPTPETIATHCENFRKIYGERCLFDSAYRPAPYSSRVYPRERRSVSFEGTAPQ